MAADEIFVLVLVLVCAGIVTAMNVHSRLADKARVQAERADEAVGRADNKEGRT